MLLLSPPALLQPEAPPAERPLEVQGFNGHPLSATVVQAQGHPYFALIVAGSGAMDRDWNTPKVPKCGAGREFSLWLKAQGIGSLRYDKRTLGAKPGTVDVSLDAQVGDIAALIKAARQLPEARGRKLLLIGHSEGALLSLVAARQADAFLAISMPGQSMARTIRDQVKSELPPKQAEVNLAFLDQVFTAIRESRPFPKAGTGVFPALERMARGLMAPESLDFVRSTLDLDPWPLASRLTIPSAMAWGDRDVQTPRPALVPSTYHGIILDLPRTNHMLRREERYARELNPATAISGYGETVPFAVLTPLREWLDTLR